jgi:hypothetical protein
MAHSISKEDLKEALLELVQSDSKFVSSLLAEMVLHLPAEVKSAPLKKQVRAQSPKIIPSYRQDIKKEYPDAGLSRETIVRLRELFADAPSSEQIISTLRN